MTREEAFKTIKENLCGMCAYGSQCMESCDISSCDNRDAIEVLQAQDLQQTCNQVATNTIDRQTAIDVLEKVAELFPWKVPGNRDSYDRYNEAWNDAIGRVEIEIEKLPSAQPDGISLEWINKHLEWLDNCDNDFAQIAKVSIRAMVELWKKDRI